MAALPGEVFSCAATSSAISSAVFFGEIFFSGRSISTRSMERILDLGCGTGDSWRILGIPVENLEVIGIDLLEDRLQVAHARYSSCGWRYICARGENIPLPAASVKGILCEVALPYMHIPRTLNELHRVLVPGGWLKATLHSPSFTWSELRRSFPKPKPSLFRVFVLFNGLVLHCSGKVLSLGSVAESCQTDAGMRIVLRRAGFNAVSFRHEGQRFYMEALRDELPGQSETAVNEPPAA
jgi:SAM-dependent methyltransferase